MDVVELRQRMEQVEAELAQQEKLWNGAQLPPPEALYQFGQSQWMHHIFMEGIKRYLIENFDAEEELELHMKEAFAEEVNSLRTQAIEARRAAIRNDIVPKGPFPFNGQR